jgi:hypothetical protein
LREEQRIRVFENRALRRIFGPKRNKMTGGWRRVHNEDLHNLYASPDILRMIKSRRMRWAGHVVCMGEMHIKPWLENVKGRGHSGNLSLDWRIMLEWVLWK